MMMLERDLAKIRQELGAAEKNHTHLLTGGKTQQRKTTNRKG
jgi:hypothetical protein